MAATEAVAFGNARAILGESPVWSVEEQAVYWIDIDGKTLYRVREPSGEETSWPLPALPGSLAVRASGGLVIALKGGFFAFDPATGGLERLCEFEPFDPEHPDLRPNDGRCDPAGRMFVGTMIHPGGNQPAGRLYRIDPDLAVSEVRDGIRIPNGLAFRPEGGTMFHTDTLSGVVDRYDYDLASGQVSNRRPFWSYADVPGGCDGACIDAEGGYWAAMFGGAKLMRLAPDGTIDREVALPVSCPTMPAFGGADLKTLYVTTSRHRLTEDQAAAEPLSGRLLRIEMDIAGLPEPKFAG